MIVLTWYQTKFYLHLLVFSVTSQVSLNCYLKLTYDVPFWTFHTVKVRRSYYIQTTFGNKFERVCDTWVSASKGFNPRLRLGRSPRRLLEGFCKLFGLLFGVDRPVARPLPPPLGCAVAGCRCQLLDPFTYSRIHLWICGDYHGLYFWGVQDFSLLTPSWGFRGFPLLPPLFTRPATNRRGPQPCRRTCSGLLWLSYIIHVSIHGFLYLNPPWGGFRGKTPLLPLLSTASSARVVPRSAASYWLAASYLVPSYSIQDTIY